MCIDKVGQNELFKKKKSFLTELYDEVNLVLNPNHIISIRAQTWLLPFVAFPRISVNTNANVFFEISSF